MRRACGTTRVCRMEALMRKVKVLGIGGSLRAARWGKGGHHLIEQITQLDSEVALKAFIERESKMHLDNFVEVGRKDGVPFDQQYKKLRRDFGRAGLSNSEVILAAALWSAKELGCEIAFVSLSEHFVAAGRTMKLAELKRAIAEADAYILSTPVYFGDRSSIAHDLIQFIRTECALSDQLKGRLYAGLAVGAKRNGGQETTLIYQLLDLVNCGLLGVGNDSETTAQYGGTAHAGDVGTAWKDEYGLWTSMGTGRRVARVAQILALAETAELTDKLKVAFWILQDRDRIARAGVEALLKECGDAVDPVVLDLSRGQVDRCIACDICPTDINLDKVYRCIITRKDDVFSDIHESFLDVDAIVPVVFDPLDSRGLNSVYQQFIERTRYLRRGDYLFSDVPVAPLVFEELGANDSMTLRMVTSMLRQHTVMTRPLIAYLQHGARLNWEQVTAGWRSFLTQARRLTVGRLLRAGLEESRLHYNPVGYILSAAKDREDEAMQKRRAMVADRSARVRELARTRTKPVVCAEDVAASAGKT